MGRIVKAAPLCDLGDGASGGGKLLLRFLYAVLLQILMGSATAGLFEPPYVGGSGHILFFGKALDRDPFLVILVNVVQGIRYLQKLTVRLCGDRPHTALLGYSHTQKCKYLFCRCVDIQLTVGDGLVLIYKLNIGKHRIKLRFGQRQKHIFVISCAEIRLYLEKQRKARRPVKLRKAVGKEIAVYQHMVYVESVEIFIGMTYSGGDHKYASALHLPPHPLNKMLTATVQDYVKLVKAVGVEADLVASVDEGFYVFVLFVSKAVRMTPMSFWGLVFHAVSPLLIRFYSVFDLFML